MNNLWHHIKITLEYWELQNVYIHVSIRVLTSESVLGNKAGYHLSILVGFLIHLYRIAAFTAYQKQTTVYQAVRQKRPG